MTVSWWQLLGAVKPVTVSWRKLLEAVEAVKRRWWVSVLAMAMATIAPHLAIEAGERIIDVSVEQREVRIATSVCVLLMVVNSAANGLHTAGSTGI